MSDTRGVRYVLMLCSDSASGMTPERQDAVIDGCGGWTEEMFRRGVGTAAVGLAPAAAGRAGRGRGGEMLLGDGPVAENKDQVGGVTGGGGGGPGEAPGPAARHPS